MNKITINDETFEVSGRNIVVVNGKIIVDEKTVKNGLSGIVEIKFEGDLANLDCTNATINGNVHGDVDSTKLTCGDIAGNVDATNVHCGAIGGDVDAVSISKTI